MNASAALPLPQIHLVELLYTPGRLGEHPSHTQPSSMPSVSHFSASLAPRHDVPVGLFIIKSRFSVLQFLSLVPAMGVALYRWGVMAQSNSSSDSSLGEESLRLTSAGAEFQSLTARGKKENL